MRLGLLLLALLTPLSAEPLKREVLALYDGKWEESPYVTNIHQNAEMPLNHLGLKLTYHDIQMPLPEVEESTIGILTWFLSGTQIPSANEYLKWLIQAIKSGKKIVIIGTPGFLDIESAGAEELIRSFWEQMGLFFAGDFATNPFSYHFVYLDKKVAEFERPYDDVDAQFLKLQTNRPDAKSYVDVSKKDDTEDVYTLAMTSKTGGYIAEEYALYYEESEEMVLKKWFINPFAFFESAFGITLRPIPDTTTLSGRRIYYSNIDGDGWNSPTYVEGYQEGATLSAAVILDQAIIPYPDLPVSVGPIAADLDKDWQGNNVSQEIAEKILRVPQVESATHTYSHPFQWSFFTHYKPADEIPFLPLYPPPVWRPSGLLGMLITSLPLHVSEAINLIKADNDLFKRGYDIPRAYAAKPFQLDLEVKGSVKLINQFAPKNKPVKILFWSGDCRPFIDALAAVQKAGLLNLNGGDTRFDSLFSSYSWVMPLGMQTGSYLQIYSSSSNENTYTDLWKKNYFGLILYQETLKNTEFPRRVKPVNIYYHMYSGEREPSLQALLANLEMARTLEIAPICASDFARIGEGFFHVSIEKIGPQKWSITNRGSCQTYRFDSAATSGIDLDGSKGVIGQRHLQGSLYVALDPAEEAPIITLKDIQISEDEPIEELPYLISCRYPIQNVRLQKNEISCEAQGFGKLAMWWKVPQNGKWSIELVKTGIPIETIEVAAAQNNLSFSLTYSGYERVALTIRKL